MNEGTPPASNTSSQPPAFQSQAVEIFWATLVRSRLLAKEQLVELQHFALREQDPRAVAKFLMDQEFISRWQARRLLEGCTDFMLGKYQLLDLAGRGATGTVYKARSSDGKLVALKVLSPKLLQNPEAMSRFEREMRLASALNHPNIVAAYDAGQLGEKCHYIAMEYVPGKDLKDWLNKHGPLPIRFACECIRQALLAMQHAHEKGIVHRDLKPGNLLVIAEDLNDKPTVKMLDMGFANVASMELKKDQLTRAEQLLGTPDYMAPEQAEDPTAADIRSDIYSLGCTLFRLLSGRPPFLGKTAMDKLQARFEAPAPSIREFCEEASPELEAVIATMLERFPEDRYATPAEAAEALKPFAMVEEEQAPTELEVIREADELPQEEAPASLVQRAKGIGTGRLVVIFSALAVATLSFFFSPTLGVILLITALALSLLLVRKQRQREEAETSRVFDFDASVDLLQHIRPEIHSVYGQWKHSDEGLLSPDVPHGRLELPLAPPKEYSLRVVVRRLEGEAAMVLGLVFGGKRCFLTLDGLGGTRSGLGLIDEKAYDRNETTHQGPVFQGDAPCEIICKVREYSIEVIADQQSIIHWAGTAEELSLPSNWETPHQERLFLGSHTAVYLFEEVMLAAPSEFFAAATL